MTNVDDQGFRDRKSINQNTANQNDLAEGVVKPEAPYDQTAYQDGYRRGLNSERRSIENLRSRENESAASGVLLGVLLAGLVGLGAGIYFFVFNQNRDTQTAPVINVPAPAQSPQAPDRIIERVVPVPQNPPDVNVPAPEVNITVPNPAQQSPTSQSQDNVAPEAEPASPQ